MNTKQTPQAAAIVGVGAILPDAPDAPTFWENIKSGKYSITEVPPDRWNPEDYYDPDPRVPDKTYSKIGSWVRQYAFDPHRWQMPIPPRVLAEMDDAQKWALACARAALLDYGYPERPLDTSRTAVILGNALAGEKHYRTALRIQVPEFAHALEDVPEFAGLPLGVREALLNGMREQVNSRIPDITEDTMPGELANIIAGRVANLLNLGGPNFVTDAACASSFAALQAALDGLSAGYYDAVLTGGVDRNMGVLSFVKFSKIGALSPDGSRPYAEGANGFVMGEGAVIFMLKRLADAERDGDAVYAVIRGIGGASDGRGKGITAPNPIGQQRAMERAWHNAAVSPGTVTYIEGHGTSTRVGDVVEVESMNRVFGAFGLPRASVALGSVKSNIGHLKGAAGAAGLLKTVYALRDKVIPPTVNFEQPNSGIPFTELPFYVNTELRPWDQPAHGVRRAGVSSFGFGGTNFHVVVEEYIPGMLASQQGQGRVHAVLSARGTDDGWHNANQPEPGGKSPPRGVLMLGASNLSGLKARLEVALADARVSQTPSPHPPTPADLDAPERLAIAFESAEELDKRATKAAHALETDIAPVWKPLASQGIYRGRGKPGKIAFLYPGQGSQYVNMLRDLADIDAVAADTFGEADRVMTPLLGRPLTDFIFADARDQQSLDNAEARLRDTAITQPAVLTINIALTRVLASYGILPDLVIGHSLGEYAALVAAGVLSFADALHIVSARGREMSKVSMADNGCMAAVSAPLAEVERILGSIDGYVVLANVNSRSQVVIGGATPAVDSAIAAFQAANYRAQKIPVSHAFHTRIVAPASEPLRQVMARMDIRSPRLPIVANVTGELYPTARDEIIDLLAQQVASPVQFVRGVETLYREGARILIEVGPKRVLTALAEDILADHEDVTVLFTNHPRKGGVSSLNEALCGLYAAGVGAKPGRPAIPDKQELEPVVKSSNITRNAQVRPTAQAPIPETSPIPVQMPPTEHVEVQPSEPTTTLATSMHPMQTLSEHAGLERISTEQDRYLALGRLFADFLEQGRRIYESQAPQRQLHATRAADGRVPLTGSVVISGAALGLPGQQGQVFADGNIDRILRGEQFIDAIPTHLRARMASKRITRLVKQESGAAFEVIVDPAETIKLAGLRGRFDLASDFGVPASRVEALDISTQLAIAAGIEALRDAGIPLVMRYRLTSKGTYLPDRWVLPEALADETGIIFGSAFPGLDRMASEVTRCDRYQFLNDQLSMLRELQSLAQASSGNGTDSLGAELGRRIQAVLDELARLDYTFDRRFIFRVLAMGHSQFAEYIGARGPNTHVNAACATTTQAIAIAEDWIRSGRCRRVIVIAGDDVTSDDLMEWVGSGLLASGATTTEERLERAALPFDRRRNGMIMGMGAAALVLEAQDAIQERGMRGICELLSSQIANSAFHGTRLDTEHICQVMDRVVRQAEERFGIDRREIAQQAVFVSHETYTPARGGSAAAEIHALRSTFGVRANQVVIANTKGYTGHTMGVGIEDVLAVKALEKGIVPPVANIDRDFQPDPELGDLNLSRGGAYPVQFALRLGAGFGSQIAMLLLRRIPGSGERTESPQAYDRWLADVAGYDHASLEVEHRTLRIRDAGPPTRQPISSTWQRGSGPKAWAPATMTEPVLATVHPQPQAAEPPAAASGRVAIPVSPAATAASPSEPPPSDVPQQHPSSADPIAERVLALVSEKTGYPPEMLDLDLDLEADLGVDTVKQAEVLAAIRQLYDIPRRDDLKLRDYNTLAKVIAFVRQSKPEVVSDPAPEAPQSPGPSEAPGVDPVAERVLALVSEKTGYPPEMLDLDLDLEADLGVDTVKQAEVLAAIRQLYDIPRRDDLKLRDYNTLAKVIAFVHDALRVQTENQPQPAPERQSLSLPAPSESSVPASSADHRPKEGNASPAVTERPETPTVPRRVPVPVLRPALEFCQATAATLEPNERVILVNDSGKVGKYLGYRLRARQVTALPLDRATPDMAAAQVREWLEQGPIAGVYFLPGLDVEASLEQMDLSCWRAEHERRVKTLYAIMRALPNNPFLVCGTRLGGLHGYGPEGATAPLGGAIVGFAKAYAMERPAALVKAVDLAIGTDERKVAECLINETLQDPGTVEIGYPPEDAQSSPHQAGGLGHRYGIGLIERPAGGSASQIRLDHDTVFLVTGGAGGITIPVVVDLAKASKGTFYLTGRTPMPDPNNPDLFRLNGDRNLFKRDIAQRIQQTGVRPTPVMVEKELANLDRAASILSVLDQVRQVGGMAYYRTCDVTDPQAVQTLVGEITNRHGHVDVIIHAAGLERSHLLPDKEPDEFSQVFDIKADGLFNLLCVMRDLERPVQAIVVFSSIAGRFGNAGQTDYSAANDLMCKTIASLGACSGTRAIAIDWSAWADTGMASRGSIPAMMRRAGIEMLHPQEAAPVVRREIAAGGGEVVAARSLGALLSPRHANGGLDLERANQYIASLVSSDYTLSLVGRVTGMDPYRGLTFEVELDPQVEPFLRDHALDGTPLLPGVIGIEGFAEVATVVVSELGSPAGTPNSRPRFRVAAVENVRFEAPLKFFRQKRRTVIWRAIVVREGAQMVAHLALESAHDRPAARQSGSSQQHTQHFTGRVLLEPFAAHAEHTIDASQPPVWNGQPTVQPEAIYRVYFHGPAFQVLEGAQAGTDRVIGKLRTDLPAITRDGKRTLLLPHLIELCLQTAGVWEIGKTGTLALPTAIDQIVFYLPQANAEQQDTHGSAIYAEIVPKEQGGQLGFDARVVDEQGVVYLELSGYRTSRLPDPIASDRLIPLRMAFPE